MTPYEKTYHCPAGQDAPSPDSPHRSSVEIFPLVVVVVSAATTALETTAFVELVHRPNRGLHPFPQYAEVVPLRER